MSKNNAQSHNPKFSLQSDQYRFPYHYIPNFDDDGTGCRFQGLWWGLEYLCYQEHIKLLVQKLNPTSIIDVGCGDGRFLGRLVGVPRRVGVDLEQKAINLARALSEDVDFVCAPVEEINEVFDVCTAIEVLEHVPDNQCTDFILSLFGIVKKNGYIVISVPSSNLPINNKHYRHYTEKVLCDQLKSASVNYDIITIDHIYHEPPWLKFYLRITYNRLWILDFAWLRRMVWRKIWDKCRHSNPKNGYHIVMVLRKMD